MGLLEPTLVWFEERWNHWPGKTGMASWHALLLPGFTPSCSPARISPQQPMNSALLAPSLLWGCWADARRLCQLNSASTNARAPRLNSRNRPEEPSVPLPQGGSPGTPIGCNGPVQFRIALRVISSFLGHLVTLPSTIACNPAVSHNMVGDSIGR